MRKIKQSILNSKVELLRDMKQNNLPNVTLYQLRKKSQGELVTMYSILKRSFLKLREKYIEVLMENNYLKRKMMERRR